MSRALVIVPAGVVGCLAAVGVCFGVANIVKIPRRTPLVSRRQVSLCSIAQADNIVKAHVVGWSKPVLMSVPGFQGSRPFSTVNLSVDATLKGTLGGIIDVLQYLGVDDLGHTTEGTYAADGSTSGVFFINDCGTAHCVSIGGFIGASAAGYKAVGLNDLVSEANLLAAIQNAGVGPDCSDLGFKYHDGQPHIAAPVVTSPSSTSAMSLAMLKVGGGSDASTQHW